MFNYKYCNNFKNNQYEDINNGTFLYGECVNAKYIVQNQPLYKNNPLIEALPPIKSYDKAFDFLKRFPMYFDEERYYSNEYRIHAIFRLLNYMLPTSSNLMTDEYLSIVIRQGYISKKIGTPQYMKILRKCNEKLISGDISENKLIVRCSVVSNPSTGFFMMGSSGAGKTSAINSSLSYYPQVIKHVLDDDGNKSVFTQIPWIRIDCSYDGKISGVCNHFFRELDLLLGTNYTIKYGSRSSTVDKMIASISFLVLRYAIGVLVVDEIQHIRHTKDGEALLNFFVTLSNTIKIPIIFIGTYKASRTILGEQYRQGRKAEGMGLVEYYRLKKDDEWNLFIETLWNYQWLKNKTPLTKEISDLMYKRTIGIIDRANKLFMAVQLEAIDSGIEKITSELINRVADEKFKLTTEIINAFESNDPNKINQYEDIKAPDVKLEEYINRNKALDKITNIYNSVEFKENVNKRMVVDAVIGILCETMEFNKRDIEKTVISVINKNDFKKDIKFLVKKVAKKLFNEELNSENKDGKKITKKLTNKSDVVRKHEELNGFIEKNKKDILDGVN